MTSNSGKPAVILGVTAEVSLGVTRGPETLRRIAAGELNPDGTPVEKEPGDQDDDRDL